MEIHGAFETMLPFYLPVNIILINKCIIANDKSNKKNYNFVSVSISHSHNCKNWS